MQKRVFSPHSLHFCKQPHLNMGFHAVPYHSYMDIITCIPKAKFFTYLPCEQLPHGFHWPLLEDHTCHFSSTVHPQEDGIPGILCWPWEAVQYSQEVRLDLCLEAHPVTRNALHLVQRAAVRGDQRSLQKPEIWGLSWSTAPVLAGSYLVTVLAGS